VSRGPGAQGMLLLEQLGREAGLSAVLAVLHAVRPARPPRRRNGARGLCGRDCGAAR